MTSKNRHTATVAAALLCAAVLGGCSGADEPNAGRGAYADLALSTDPIALCPSMTNKNPLSRDGAFPTIFDTDVFNATHPSFRVAAFTVPQVSNEGQADELWYYAKTIIAPDTWCNWTGDAWRLSSAIGTNADRCYYWPLWKEADAGISFSRFTPLVDFFAMTDGGNNDQPRFSLTNSNTAVSLTAEVDYGDGVPARDLLVAHTQQARLHNGGTAQPVPLEFQHAMAKVKFEFSCDNPDIELEVENLHLCNMLSSGTLTFLPNRAHGENFFEWVNPGNRRETRYGNGRAVLNTVFINGTNHPSSAPVVMTQNTDGNHTTSENEPEAFFMMIPQTLYPWNHSINNPNATAYLRVWVFNFKNKGNNIILNSQFLNVSLLPDSMTGGLTLQPGMEYVFHVNFTVTGGGFDNNGNQILHPVAILARVTPFTDGGSWDVDVN